MGGEKTGLANAHGSSLVKAPNKEGEGALSTFFCVSPGEAGHRKQIAELQAAASVLFRDTVLYRKEGALDPRQTCNMRDCTVQAGTRHPSAHTMHLYCMWSSVKYMSRTF